MSNQPLAAAQPVAPLLGRWQFQYQEQRIYRAGEVVEVLREEPPANSCQALAITEQTLTWQYKYLHGSPTGHSGYPVTRPYTRHGRTLLVVPGPGIEPPPTAILRLTDAQLVFLKAPTPGLSFSYEWETGFTR